MAGTFEIVRKIAQLGESSGDYTRQINLIKWNKGQPKYDIRRWKGDTACNGVTLDDDEAKALYEALAKEFGATAE